jgi:hypothetical protein
MCSKLKPAWSIVSPELWIALLESAKVDSMVKAAGAPILVHEACEREKGQREVEVGERETYVVGAGLVGGEA